jgi:hypothetical protein
MSLFSPVFFVRVDLAAAMSGNLVPANFLHFQEGSDGRAGLPLDAATRVRY